MHDKIYFSDSDIKRHGVFKDMENTVNPDGTMDIAQYHYEAECSGLVFDILASLMAPNHSAPELKRYIISAICKSDHKIQFVIAMDYREMVNVYVSPETGDIWAGNNMTRFKVWSNSVKDVELDLTKIFHANTFCLSELGGTTRFNSLKGNGVFHIADYSTTMIVKDARWLLKIREEINQYEDGVEKPRSYTVWGTERMDIRKRFVHTFEGDELIQFYLHETTGDIWAKSGGKLHRVFCEEYVKLPG